MCWTCDARINGSGRRQRQRHRRCYTGFLPDPSAWQRAAGKHPHAMNMCKATSVLCLCRCSTIIRVQICTSHNSAWSNLCVTGCRQTEQPQTAILWESKPCCHPDSTSADSDERRHDALPDQLRHCTCGCLPRNPCAACCAMAVVTRQYYINSQQPGMEWICHAVSNHKQQRLRERRFMLTKVHIPAASLSAHLL